MLHDHWLGNVGTILQSPRDSLFASVLVGKLALACAEGINDQPTMSFLDEKVGQWYYHCWLIIGLAC